MENAKALCPVELRAAAELGETRIDGLSGRHHFCFAAYQRSDRVRWGALRAVNQYRLAGEARRAPTFHAGFEILTLVTSGQLRRVGTFRPAALLGPGSVELISTGIGADLGLEAVGGEAEYIELWLVAPASRARARRQVRPAAMQGKRQMLAGRAGTAAHALALQTDAQVRLFQSAAGESAELVLGPRSCAYGVVLGGALAANDVRAAARDGFAAAGPGRLVLRFETACDLLLVGTETLD